MGTVFDVFFMNYFCLVCGKRIGFETFKHTYKIIFKNNIPVK